VALLGFWRFLNIWKWQKQTVSKNVDKKIKTGMTARQDSNSNLTKKMDSCMTACHKSKLTCSLPENVYHLAKIMNEWEGEK
jgi:hypothetical protein